MGKYRQEDFFDPQSNYSNNNGSGGNGSQDVNTYFDPDTGWYSGGNNVHQGNSGSPGLGSTFGGPQADTPGGGGSDYYGANGFDQGPLAYLPQVKNPDPYAQQANPSNYKYGGPTYNAYTVAGANRGRSAQALGQQAYQMDPSQANQARGYQDAAAQAYMAQLNGKNSSLAQLQMQQGLGQSNAAASGMAASARGGGANLAAAQRAAMMSQGQMSSQAGQNSAMLRAQEDAMARQGLAGVGGQMRGQDIGWQQANAANEMQQRQLNQQAAQGWERLAQSPEQQQLGASMAYAKDQGQNERDARQQRYDQEQTNTKYAREDSKGVLGALSSLFSF